MVYHATARGSLGGRQVCANVLGLWVGSASANCQLPKPERYDLDGDPFEADDVERKHLEIVQQLQAQLEHEIAAFSLEVQQTCTAPAEEGRLCHYFPRRYGSRSGGQQPDWAKQPDDRL